MPIYTKSEFIYIKGKANFFRTHLPNKWNKWSTQLYLDDKGLEVLRELQTQGVKNTIKKDDDGYFTSFSRPVTKTTATGRVISFTPVEVFDKDGNRFDGNVGNGSDVTLKLEVYSHNTPSGSKAKAIRWVSARIDNLVPWEADRDMNEFEKKGTKTGETFKNDQLF